VADRLRKLVVSGAYEPGTQLSEVDLAERFGVSRGPIREALQRLVHEGLLRSEPHRGVFFPTIGEGDIVDIYIAREAIESAAVKLIMQQPDRRAVSRRLDHLVSQMRRAAEADDWVRVADLDMQFHSALVRASGSDRLSRMYGTLIDETRVLLSMIAGDSSRGGSVDEHAMLARLLASDRADEAMAAVSRHFTDSLRWFREQRGRAVGHANMAPGPLSAQSTEGGV